MATWDVDATEALVHSRFGHEQLGRASASLQSVPVRWKYAAFHWREMRRLYAAVNVIVPRQRHPFDLVISSSKDSQTFLAHQFEASAHAIACVQSMHSLVDIVAHAAYYSTALDQHPQPLKLKGISCGTVAERMQSHAPLVALALDSVTEGEDHRYLRELVNQSKHRSVVRSPITFDATGEAKRSHWAQFEAFEHEPGARWPAREVLPFVEAELRRLSGALIEVGRKLDDFLA